MPESQKNQTTLPRLRDDLEFSPSDANRHGGVMWVLHDPLRNKYFRIDEDTKAILTRWNQFSTAQELAASVDDEMQLPLTSAKLDKLIQFLTTAELVASPDGEHWQDVYAKAKAGKPSLWQTISTKHLFMRFPLIYPQRFLNATAPTVERLFFTRQFAVLIALIALFGLYFVSREWSAVTSAFQRNMSAQGLLYFVFILPIVKLCHELGHAYAAAKAGSRVSSMGVAFMMGFPILYTDVSNAWKTANRLQRIWISAAGIAVELCIAAIATVLWVFLPDGALRDIAFVLASTAWLMSLLVNLNPLMKFDGYYILSDLTRLENLQSRSTAFGKWKVRQTLFAPALAPPEKLNQTTSRFLIAFGFSMWVYRLIIFTAFALLAYHFTFKLLGIFLFAVEIWLLIIKPVVAEIGQWRKFDESIVSKRRMKHTAFATVAVLMFLCVPWTTSVHAPAVMQASDLAQIYPPVAGRIVSVDARFQQSVAAGDLLLKLELPQLESSIETAKIRLDALTIRLGRAISNRDDRENLLVLEQQVAALQTELDGLRSQQAEMTVRAPMDGTVLQLGENLHPGRWVGKDQLIALISARDDLTIRGYVDEAGFERLPENAQGTFVPDDVTRGSISVTLTSKASSGAERITIAELADTYGGAIPVSAEPDQEMRPLQARFQIDMVATDKAENYDRLITGSVRMKGAAESLALRFFKQISRVLVREIGF